MSDPTRNDYLLLEKDYNDLKSRFEELQDSEKRHSKELQDSKKTIGELSNQLQAMRTQYREEIAEFQSKTRRGIDACVLILTEICNSQSSHWQKKENIRLACEVLKKFKIEGNGFLPFAWEDDY